MNVEYQDILASLGEPLWWNEWAVPRYCAFSPQECDVYALEVVLMRIACQACGREFVVAMSLTMADKAWGRAWPDDEPPHYGDPPNIGCCPAGPTMNSEHIAVLQHWKRGRDARSVIRDGWSRVDDASEEVRG